MQWNKKWRERGLRIYPVNVLHPHPTIARPLPSFNNFLLQVNYAANTLGIISSESRDQMRGEEGNERNIRNGSEDHRETVKEITEREWRLQIRWESEDWVDSFTLLLRRIFSGFEDQHKKWGDQNDEEIRRKRDGEKKDHVISMEEERNKKIIVFIPLFTSSSSLYLQSLNLCHSSDSKEIPFQSTFIFINGSLPSTTRFKVFLLSLLNSKFEIILLPLQMIYIFPLFPLPVTFSPL